MFRDAYVVRDQKSYDGFVGWFARTHFKKDLKGFKRILGCFKKSETKVYEEMTLADKRKFNKLLAEKSSCRKYSSAGAIEMPAGHKLARKIKRRSKGFGSKCYV